MKAYKTKATRKNLQNTKHKTQAKIIAYFKRPLPLIPISFVFILFLLLLGSCETNEIVVKSVIPKDFKVNNISSEKLNEKLNRTKNKSDLRRFMVSSKNNLQQSKITSESGIVIETDNIKEITQGYYASYTMLLKIPNTNSQTFYNITIEVKNNTSTFFITGYFPTENWKENPSQKYEGQITTFRILGSGGGSSSNILQEYVEDIIQDNDLLSGQYGFGNTPGLGGPSSSYPWDCDGEVVTTYVIQPVMCSQNVHWPWSTGPCSASLKAYYDFITTYACLQSPFNNDPIEGSPHDGNYYGGVGNNNGSANNPAASLTTIIVPIKTEKEIKQIFQAGLTPEQLAWWNNPVNESSVASIIEYLTQNQTFDVESDNPFDFMNWAINYLMTNSSVTFEQFQNWFLTPREGQDYIYDSTYWENPSLTFPQQNLPTFQNFDTNYPRMNGEQLAQLVGGDVLNLYNQYPSVVRGFCALKVSRALNYSGVTIPNITTSNGNPGTVLGGDGKYYFLNAKALNKWMQKTFGVSPTNSNHIKILGSQGGENGGNFPTLTAGIKGIYSMVSSNPDWASGHADLINEGICVFGCHFYDNPPAPIDYIDIWILN